MNMKITSTLLAACALLGCAVNAHAQQTRTDTATYQAESTRYGLLGSTYSGLSFDYYDVHGTQEPNVGRGISFVNNTPINEHIDARLDYDYTRATSSFRSITRNRVTAGAVGYTAMGWAKPFLGADLGYKWLKDFGTQHGSIVVRSTAGLEIPVVNTFAVTPYAAFERATRFNQNQWNYGVKANYQVNRDWNLVAGSELQDYRRGPDTTRYSLGAGYHF